MKTLSTFLKLAVALFAFTATLQSCTEEDDDATVPTVTTVEVADISFGSATLGGTIVSNGGAGIIAKGICYGTQPEPTIADDTTNQGSGSEAFTSTLQGLTPNNIYYARAYATNRAGTSYGEEFSFGTESGAPSITFSISATYYKRAVSQWTVTSPGASPVDNSGFCYSTENAYPTTQDAFWTIGTGDTWVQKVIEGLEAGTHYYIRAFASNNHGTTYSDVIEVTTLAIPTATDVDGNSYGVVLIGDQAWMTENLRVTKYNNGDAIPTTAIDLTSEATANYQWVYNNNESNAVTYGRLYTNYAVTDERKVCPSGWHIPTLGEWEALIANAGGYSSAGGALKKTGTDTWLTPNAGATNSTGFSAVGSGVRSQNGVFNALTFFSYYQTATEASAGYNKVAQLNYSDDNVSTAGDVSKKLGLPVRCTADIE
jgi:uncharacterized protein (TIGR02145 family)